MSEIFKFCHINENNIKDIYVFYKTYDEVKIIACIFRKKI